MAGEITYTSYRAKIVEDKYKYGVGGGYTTTTNPTTSGAYVPIAGGTMTGDLVMSDTSIIIQESSSAATDEGIIFQDIEGTEQHRLGRGTGTLNYSAAGGTEYGIYHANNANKSTVAWATANLTVTGTVNVAGNIYINETGATERFLKIGYGRTGTGNSYIDLIGDATYSLYGLRIIRNSLVSGNSILSHRGTGDFVMQTVESAEINFLTNLVTRFTIASTGLMTMTNDLYLSATTTDTRTLKVGYGRTGDGNSYIDLIGDATYSTYGLRLERQAGYNSYSLIQHRGTGDFYITAYESANIVFTTTSLPRFVIYDNGNAGTSSFSSGFTGSGWQMTLNSDYTLTVDNLVVRKALTAYELDINKINSVNGGIIVSVANGTALTVSGTTIYFDEDGTNKQIQFQVNDYVRAQVWTGRGINSYVGLVTAVNHSSTYGSANIVATTISGTPYNGMELVQIGNTTDTARQNLIYITAADTNNPYIDMLAGVNDGSFTGKQKLRIGNLTGITDANFGGALSGYGLWADNVYLSGKIVISSGSSGVSNLSDAGDLAVQDTVTWSTQVTGTGKPADNATVGATWGTNLNSIPATLSTPSGAGLYLSSTYMGYYNGTGWKTYMDSSGNFALGDTTGTSAGMVWNQSAATLSVYGAITAVSGLIGGWTINSTYLAKDTGTASTSAGMSPSDYPFYAGSTYANRVTAPFRVSNSGSVTATSGLIGGWTITSNALYSTNCGIVNGDNVAFFSGDTYANREAAPFRVTADEGLMFLTYAATAASGEGIRIDHFHNTFPFIDLESSTGDVITLTCATAAYPLIRITGGGANTILNSYHFEMYLSSTIQFDVNTSGTTLYVQMDGLPQQSTIDSNSDNWDYLKVHATTGQIAYQ